MPAPELKPWYLPWRRKWNGTSTAAKNDSAPCAASVLPVESSAMPLTFSDALLVRSTCVMGGEKKFCDAITMLPEPAVWPDPNAIHLWSPEIDTYVVSVRPALATSIPCTNVTSLPFLVRSAATAAPTPVVDVTESDGSSVPGG